MFGTRSAPHHTRQTRTGLFASAVCMCLLGSVGFAQEDPSKQVLLEAVDGSVRLSGELADFEDGFYTLQTEIGLITIAEESVQCSGPGCPSLDGADEEEVDRTVRLIADEGETEVVGELIDFNDDIYTLRTALGTLQIDVEGVQCVGAVCPEIEEVRRRFSISGGRYATGDLIPQLLEGFAESQGLIYDAEEEVDGQRNIRLLDSNDGSIIADIGMQSATSAGAFAALASKQADIAIVDQQLPRIMWERVAEEYRVAYDALVVVTHEDNPVRDLSVSELGLLWSGASPTWVPFGGGNIPVKVHMMLEEADRIPTVFREKIMNANGLDNQNLSAVTFHRSGEDVAKAVSADRNAIGVVNRVIAEEARSRVVELRKSCGLTSAPTDFELTVENYPLSRPVLAYIATADTHPVAKQFLEWTRLNEAQLRVSDAGFSGDRLQRMKMRDLGVGIMQTSVLEEFNGAQFSSMMRELRDADRLSITFRFQTGSSLLDEESVGFVQDMADRLRANEFEGLEVLLVGFADSNGDATLNTSLAQQRAEAVRQILLNEFDAATAQRFNLQALSFGEQMPIDCNTTEAGQANNRRVEIWVRRPGR